MELLPHIQQTTWQDTLPEMRKTSTDKANRGGVAERFPDPAVHKSVAVALALMDVSAQFLRDGAWTSVQTAKQHAAQTLSLLQAVPGLGKIVRVVRLYELHARTRCPRVQDVVSYGRVGKCAKASAGKRDGPAGTKRGHASLQWAFAAAAVLFLRNNPAGHKSLARCEHKHGQGKALTVLAHTLARAVSYRLKREVVFALATFLQSEGRGVGAPAAALGQDGLSLAIVRCPEARIASPHAHEHRGTVP